MGYEYIATTEVKGVADENVATEVAKLMNTGFICRYDELFNLVDGQHRGRAPQSVFRRSLPALKRLIEKRRRLYKEWNNGRAVDNARYYKVVVTRVKA